MLGNKKQNIVKFIATSETTSMSVCSPTYRSTGSLDNRKETIGLQMMKTKSLKEPIVQRRIGDSNGRCFDQSVFKFALGNSRSA